MPKVNIRLSGFKSLLVQLSLKFNLVEMLNCSSITHIMVNRAVTGPKEKCEQKAYILDRLEKILS